jgi:hypothetical protein
MFSKNVMVTALATAALVWPAAAPARPADQGPPPPPSSIAVSAADDYAQLRASAGGTQDDDVSAGGFDAVSIALGLVARIGLAIAAVALAGGLAGTRQLRRHVARS